MGFNVKTNGCGACSGFWRWFKPPHHNFFKSVCNRHDEAYDLGGTKLDRHIADLSLKYNMVEMINKHFYKRKPISRLWYLLITQTYYYGVRMFGKPNFNYETKREN